MAHSAGAWRKGGAPRQGERVFPAARVSKRVCLASEIRLRMGCAKLDRNVSRRKSPAMIDPKMFEEFSARLGSIIAASPVADIEKNARALLSSFFAKLDLVSREEFDIQAQVLLRTREKLKALEERVARLERRDGNNG